MAVLKYKSNGTIKTLGVTESGVSGVSSVNGKTGIVTGLYDQNNQPPYPVTSVNGKTGNVVISASTIKSAILAFNFRSEDGAHVCQTQIVNSADKIISIKPKLVNVFAGGIDYSGGFLITTLFSFYDGNMNIYTNQIECEVIYYE